MCIHRTTCTWIFSNWLMAFPFLKPSHLGSPTKCTSELGTSVPRKITFICILVFCLFKVKELRSRPTVMEPKHIIIGSNSFWKQGRTISFFPSFRSFIILMNTQLFSMFLNFVFIYLSLELKHFYQSYLIFLTKYELSLSKVTNLRSLSKD